MFFPFWSLSPCRLFRSRSLSSKSAHVSGPPQRRELVRGSISDRMVRRCTVHLNSAIKLAAGPGAIHTYSLRDRHFRPTAKDLGRATAYNRSFSVQLLLRLFNKLLDKRSLCTLQVCTGKETKIDAEGGKDRGRNLVGFKFGASGVAHGYEPTSPAHLFCPPPTMMRLMRPLLH